MNGDCSDLKETEEGRLAFYSTFNMQFQQLKEDLQYAILFFLC